MRKIPGAIFIIDPNNEHIAVKEAKCLGIPVVALTDTNCDPTGIDYVVPANDDAIKSIGLFMEYFGQAVAEGGAKNRREDGEDGIMDGALEKEILAKYEKDIDLKLASDEE